MPRHDTVVGIRRLGQDRRIRLARPDVVIRRIGIERLEIGFLRRIAIIVDPITPRGEAVEAQHVHHADGRQRRREQIGPLVGHRPDEQTAVRSTLDDELIRAGDMLRLQELARRDEIVEHVLLVGEPAAVVPRLAIFAAAADVGDREHPTLLEPRDPRRREGRRHRDVEAAIRIEQCRCGACYVLALDDEHRNLGAVLRRVETLLDRIARRIERDLGRRPRRRLARADIVAIDRRRRGEAGEGVEGLGIVGVAAKAADIADSRQRHDAIGLAVERVATHFALHVGEVGQQQLAADDRRAVEHVLALWHHLVLGHLGRARVEVGRDDPQPRRILVG